MRRLMEKQVSAIQRYYRMLGGDPFSSIVEGRLLDPPVDFELVSAHYDPHALDGLGQLLSSYQRANYPK